jgi:ribosomal protein S18 acetylase RimI-like enzyme
MNIEYIETGEQGLELIKPLWLKLNELHKKLSPHNATHFHGMTFERRKADLLKKSAGGTLHIDLARDGETKELIGYCVTTINTEKHGEIESIYIESDYRRNGIGDMLMKKALNWLEEQSVTRRIIAVAAGNEDVFEFYQRYGFYPRATILEQAESG